MADPAAILANAQAYAQSLGTQASSAIAQTLNTISNRSAPYSYIPTYVDVLEFRTPTILPPPPVSQLSLELPEEPSTTVAYQGISAIEVGVIPEFSVPIPTFDDPSKPSQLAAFVQGAPTINTSFTFPEPPTALSNPDLRAPTAASVSMPLRPELALPEMTLAAPEFEGGQPGDLRTATANAYREAAPQFITMVNGYVDAELTKLNPQYHDQMGKIEAQLSKYLEGGTGLAPGVEEAIYNRARARNDLEAKKVQDAAMADAAARGFTLPSGAMFSSMNRARQDAANNANKTSNEIIVMQAELEQKNLQFAVTTSTGLRTAMVNATLSYMQNLGQLNGQAMDYAKTVLGAITEGYNLSVKAYTVRLDAFRAAAALYEIKLKASSMKLELYRGELQAVETEVGVDRLKVDIFKARVDSLTSLSNMYRTQIDTVVSQAGLEKLRLDLFRSQVEAYSAQVTTKNAEWQGYSAQISGQQAQANLFAAQVSGYAAQIQGFKTKVEAQSEVVRAQIATNQAAAEQVKTAAAVFQSIVQARGAAVSVQAELEKLKLASYSENTKSEISIAQMNLDHYKTKSALAVDIIGKRVDALATSSQAATAQMQALGTVGVAGANIYGSLAGAALAGINVLAASTETI